MISDWGLVTRKGWRKFIAATDFNHGLNGFHRLLRYQLFTVLSSIVKHSVLLPSRVHTNPQFLVTNHLFMSNTSN